MKKFVTLALVLVMTLSMTANAFACTGFYVGKQASADGTVLFGHTVDSSNTTQTIQIVVPRIENEPGRTITSWGGFSWPLPDTTYGYVAAPFRGESFHSNVVNDMGVGVSASITCYVSDEIAKMDPVVRGGLSEAFLCALVGATAATAREGVEVLAKVIDEIGNAEQNTIFIVDQNEGWYMETYTGHQWCAVKMPEDCVAVFGNEFMLGTVENYVEGESLLHSDGLFTMPEEAGLAVYDENGNMDLFATYSGNLLANASNRRTWYGHVMLAPSTAGEYGTHTRYDLFYQPDEKVTLNDVFEVTRARFEGTEWCPDTTGRIDQRVIATEKQSNIGVIQVYDADVYPADMGLVMWNCMANAEHSVYLPLSNLITDVAPAYKYQPERGGYNTDMAHVLFKRLCALSEQDRVHYGAGVRDYWRSVEEELVATYPDVLAETLALYQTDKAAAAEHVTQYTVSLENKTLEEANQMYDELTWYMIANTSTMRYSYDSSTMTVGDQLVWEPFVPSLATAEE